MAAARIASDTKDWTWVLERPCPECGFIAADVDPSELAGRLRGSGILAGRDAPD